MANGYNVSAMADYSKSNGQILIADLLLEGQSFNQEGIAIQDGIKSSDKMVDFSVQGQTFIQKTLNDVGLLGYSGGTLLLDVTIAVTELAVKERYVTSSLNAKITQLAMAKGSDPSSELAYADTLVSLKAKAVGMLNDKILWQGDTASGNTDSNTKLFDGWLKKIKAGAYVTGGTSALLSGTTAIAKIEAIQKATFDAFPAWIDGAYMFMSPANYSVYYRQLFALNTVIDGLTINTERQPQSFVIPGTNMVVQSTNGLAGRNEIVVTREGNLVIGTDLVSEDDFVKLEFLNEQQCWRLEVVYKLGAAVARPSEVVLA
jgi:hypothetical protein